jgi:2-(1,2-epoxy-1,2-dihydrophenyl)acetyl-CoA isomerase
VEGVLYLKELALSRNGRVATITIDRPKARNAMSRDMWLALPLMLEELWHDDGVGCVTLTGTGQAFCAGGDVKDMADRLTGKLTTTVTQEAGFIRKIMESSRLLHEMPKPTLAVVNGACAGAGFALALACDLRIAANDVKITSAFADIGGSGDFGGSWFLSNIVGTAKARELYYFSTMFSGQQAEQMGIVNRAVPQGELADLGRQWSRQLANGPSVALGYIKRNMNLAEHGTLAQAFDQEALHMSLALRTDDHREAATAFVGKRKPVFEGR